MNLPNCDKLRSEGAFLDAVERLMDAARSNGIRLAKWNDNGENLYPLSESELRDFLYEVMGIDGVALERERRQLQASLLP